MNKCAVVRMRVVDCQTTKKRTSATHFEIHCIFNSMGQVPPRFLTICKPSSPPYIMAILSINGYPSMHTCCMYNVRNVKNASMQHRGERSAQKCIPVSDDVMGHVTGRGCIHPSRDELCVEIPGDVLVLEIL